MLELLVRLTVIVFATTMLISIVLTVVNFPYDTDPVVDTSRNSVVREYYKDAYETSELTLNGGPFEENEEYVRKARAHAQAAGIPQRVKAFVENSRLENGRALEVGAGSGLLQDVIADYFAMDISLSAKRFFRKPFVGASATAIPFRDNSFDAVWSIWVLEHIRNPERALTEIRRVVKNNGYILLQPAWNCDPWAADGYEVRPYSDFGLKGRLIKASLRIRLTRWYALLYARQVRLLRTLGTLVSNEPSRLHFVRLKPNYSKYWVTDSDAAVSLDFYDVYLWFTSRGDECVNCPSQSRLLLGRLGPEQQALIVRVNKIETNAVGIGDTDRVAGHNSRRN